MNHPQKIELLAPAREITVAISAINHGADAVYIGAPSHGARAAATNTISEIARLTEYAHWFNVKVYTTVNTLIYDHELIDVERMICELYRAGVDALIVQDLSILKLDIPPIDLHASTQCDIRTPERARFLASCGFSQLVLPRELTISETTEIRHALDSLNLSQGPIALEAFVHGALCVSYSGACNAGFITSGRSANRGECPQLCRLPYDLLDMDGNVLLENRHLLSLRDLNRTASLEAMLDSGITSFKIEGRLKDEAYVKNVTAHYRRELDKIIAAHPDKWMRGSVGIVDTKITPNVSKSFNRGFTEYFTHASRPANLTEMASIKSPKSIGEVVGKVISVKGNVVRTRLTADLSNGDGLGFFDTSDRFCGFRLNRVEGETLFAATVPTGLRIGAALYRNRDKAYDDSIKGVTSTRLLRLNLTLRISPSGILCLEGEDERGCRVTITDENPREFETAKTSQYEARRRALSKMGDTIYRLDLLSDQAGNHFIPLSILSNMRRRLTDLLDQAARMTYKYARRRQAKNIVGVNDTAAISANVANTLARSVYDTCGLTLAMQAVEVAERAEMEYSTPLMTTRYCLRRELGECLCQVINHRKFPFGSLLLRPSDVERRPTFRVDFDCKNCGMKIWLHKKTDHSETIYGGNNVIDKTI